MANEVRKIMGKPPIYKTPKDMLNKLNEYFENPPTKKHYDKDGGTFEVPHVTITGLCIYLGFDSRQSFYDYAKKEEYSYILKTARTFIENDYESLLTQGQCTGAIFALKCMGWDDKSAETIQMTPIPLNIDFNVKQPHGEIEVTEGK